MRPLYHTRPSSIPRPGDRMMISPMSSHDAVTDRGKDNRRKRMARMWRCLGKSVEVME